MIYALDTNVVVDALRQPDELDRLRAFLAWALPTTVLSAVVVAELAAGARTDRARRALDEQFVAPFAQRGRVLAPTVATWRAAGFTMSRASTGGGIAASRLNDLLLAHQSRESGWTLITRDKDFSSLRESITGLKLALPFPSR